MSNTDFPVEWENLITAAIDAAEDICDPLDGLVEKTAPIPERRLRPRHWSGSLR
jgi:hypothetical protein